MLLRGSCCNRFTTPNAGAHSVGAGFGHWEVSMIRFLGFIVFVVGLLSCAHHLVDSGGAAWEMGAAKPAAPSGWPASETW